MSERKHGLLGKANPQFPVGLKDWKTYMKPGMELPSPPDVVNDYSKVAGWPMDGNDKYGDCTMAAAAHSIQLWNAVTDRSDPEPTELSVVGEYLKLTHGADSGLIESTVLKTWRSTGLWGNKIVGYAPVNVHDLNQLKQAIYVYGLAYVGIQMPQNAQTQFDDGKPWSLEEGWQSQPIVGGHAITIVGYDAQYLHVVTWDAVQSMAYDWWQTYGDEAWAILPQEFKEAGGYNNLNLVQLAADLHSV
ncbi:hypothetical protein [Trinickia fusca]|uniref:Peptidase C39-like domain-containing protein n=1 Tax=Trinickia fusca TaxID=2419777 RepID=A0A494X8A3_9BURK|nr:hypothetical protein [Trinickia fusca]RKP46947.1 hypothetical protein D7S89_16495 [Trinickia fusca]